MIAGQVLQTTIDGIKEISHAELGVFDAEGREQAVTAPVFSESVDVIRKFAESPADSQSWGEFEFFKVFDERTLSLYLFCAERGKAHSLSGEWQDSSFRGL